MIGWFIDMRQSIVQTDDIKRCFITHQRCGDGGEPLEKHHIINGALRDWADREGLWIYITPQMHHFLHNTSKGILIQGKVLKALAEAMWILSKMPPDLVEEAKDEWMKQVRKNYL